LKVQDGCNNRCSFCIIPSVRGQSRSMKLERVIAEADALVESGYREIVLSGINLGRWAATSSRKCGSTNCSALCWSVPALKRYASARLSRWTGATKLIALVAGSSRIARHAHLPLQSGSDAILRGMHRKYRPWHYAEKIRKSMKPCQVRPLARMSWSASQ